jgi:polysaccharide biosynthesis protein PslG
MPCDPPRTAKIFTRFACGALLVLGMLLSFASPSNAAAAFEPGVVSDLTWGISDLDKQRVAAATSDAGARWTRLTLGWRGIEPTKGSYSSWHLQDLDRAVQLSHDSGVKVILNLVEAPQWASGSSDKYVPPRNPQDVADFMRFITNRYKGTVEAYEIWNEENGDRFWPPGGNATAYTAVLRAVYPAIKAVDPSATVVFGGLANADYRFVEAAYAAGAKGYFDVMGVHPYSCWSPDSYWWVDTDENWLAAKGPAPNSSARISMYTYPGYREVRKSMLAHGDDKPIWFTEMGWSSSPGSCVVDEATQATHLTRAFQMAESDPYVQVALWYNIRQDYWDPSGWDGGFGLLRKDFTPKPAYSAFEAYATGTAPTPDPTPGPTPTPEPTPNPTPPPPPRPPNQALTIILLKPVAGQTFTRQLPISVQANDDQMVTRVEFLVDGKRVNTDYRAPYRSTWKPKRAAYGKHTVTVRAFDSAGLSASASTSVTRVRYLSAAANKRRLK